MKLFLPEKTSGSHKIKCGYFHHAVHSTVNSNDKEASFFDVSKLWKVLGEPKKDSTV